MKRWWMADMTLAHRRELVALTVIVLVTIVLYWIVLTGPVGNPIWN